jgi:hypothetical protein
MLLSEYVAAQCRRVCFGGELRAPWAASFVSRNRDSPLAPSIPRRLSPSDARRA